MKIKVSELYYKQLLNSIKALQYVINFNVNNYKYDNAELVKQLAYFTRELSASEIDTSEYGGLEI